MKRAITLFFLLCVTPLAAAKGVYMTEEAFLNQAFDGAIPERKALWLRGELKSSVSRVLGQPYGKIRLHYWYSGSRSAWVLEQIGKDKPITAGFVVEGLQIVQTEVLAFRESRGWEIKRPAFTRQFELIHLTTDNLLSRPVDGITGATLSVQAMNRMARLSLLLAQEVQSRFAAQK